MAKKTQTRASHLVVQSHYLSDGRQEVVWAIYRRGYQSYAVRRYRGFHDTVRATRISGVLNRYIASGVAEVATTDGERMNDERQKKIHFVVYHLPIVHSQRDIRALLSDNKTWVNTTRYELINPFRLDATSHTESCLKAAKNYTSAALEYDRQFPLHCRFCGGWGGFVSHFNPDPSSGPGYLEDFETCPFCYDRGLCPRCGHELEHDEDTDGRYCDNCNYSDQSNTGGAPEGYECECWHERLKFDH